jgi:glutathione peroxidase-family protein
MKFLFLFISMFLFKQSGSSIYEISIETIESNTISLSAFAGKKLLIVEFNAAHPDTAQLVYLDQLQKKGDPIKVIAVPAIDFGGTVDQRGLVRLKIILGPDFIMTKPSRTNKKDIDQSRLLRWLTNASENSHFNMDVEGEGQVFIVSEKGTLYSVITKSSPKEMIEKVLYRGIKE